MLPSHCSIFIKSFHPLKWENPLLRVATERNGKNPSQHSTPYWSTKANSPGNTKCLQLVPKATNAEIAYLDVIRSRWASRRRLPHLLLSRLWSAVGANKLFHFLHLIWCKTHARWVEPTRSNRQIFGSLKLVIPGHLNHVQTQDWTRPISLRIKKYSHWLAEKSEVDVQVSHS